MTQPVLGTQRLQLVPLAAEHLPYEIELDADPEVMRYLGDGRPRTAEQVTERHADRLAEGVGGLGFWVGFDGGSFVGWWILGPPNERHAGESTAELGYRLLPRAWRRGFASEGSAALLAYAFETCGLASVYAETMAVNVASRATMASVGLRYVRTFHLEWDDPIPGYEQGEVEYAITREEWLSR